MKNTIKIGSLAVCAALGVVFTSCNKLANIEPTTSTQSSAVVPETKSARLGAIYRVYFDNGGTDYGCKDTGGNCYTDQAATGAVIGTINVIENANPIAIKNHFLHSQAIKSFIPGWLIEGIVNGNLNVSMKGSLTNGVGTKMMIFSNIKDNSIENVLPFIHN